MTQMATIQKPLVENRILYKINPVPADLAEFALVAHLDFAKPL
jgi:hypothetical protein